MSYALKDNQLQFSDDFEIIRIVSRTNANDVKAELQLREFPVEVVVNFEKDEVAIVALTDGLTEPFTRQLVDTTQDAYFGLDTLCMGGVGISDLRDNYREAHVFDLAQCRLTYQVQDVLDTKTMLITGKGSSDAAFYRRVKRKKTHSPI